MRAPQSKDIQGNWIRKIIFPPSATHRASKYWREKLDENSYMEKFYENAGPQRKYIGYSVEKSKTKRIGYSAESLHASHRLFFEGKKKKFTANCFSRPRATWCPLRNIGFCTQSYIYIGTECSAEFPGSWNVKIRILQPPTAATALVFYIAAGLFHWGFSSI